MYIVDPSRWDTSRDTGQARFVVDAWLEQVSDDVSHLFSLPLYSTLQLFRNLQRTLADVDRGVVESRHVRDMTEEILDRLEQECWLDTTHPHDLGLLREHLRQVQAGHDQVSIRARFASLLRAFLGKVQGNDPIRCEFEHVQSIAANTAANFSRLERALNELINDLLHAGHSRGFLHRWLLAIVVGAPSSRPYLERLAPSGGLDGSSSRDYEVFFRCQAPPHVPATEEIRFIDSLPCEVVAGLTAQSPFLDASVGRFAVVRVAGVCDWLAAVELARDRVRRYFDSTRLEHFRFGRVVEAHAVVRELPSNRIKYADGLRELTSRPLHNDETFYALQNNGVNKAAFAELDRVLYWLERSRQAQDEGRLIALWTALEFLFGIPAKPIASALAEALPAYFAPNYARTLLIDFWRHICHARIPLGAALERELSVAVTATGRRDRTCHLGSLLRVCIEDEAVNRIKPLIQGYPILVRKWYRVRRLNPAVVPAATNKRAIYTDIEALERQLAFDIRTCYRARNMIVHDAANNLGQIDRLSQWLSWLLSTAVDTLLYQYCRNPSLSLIDLHQANLASYERWKTDLADPQRPVVASDVLSPRTYFLA